MEQAKKEQEALLRDPPRWLQEALAAAEEKRRQHENRVR